MKILALNIAIALTLLLPKTTHAQSINECDIIRLMVDTIASLQRIDTVSYAPKVLSLNPITGKWDTGAMERVNISSSVVIFDKNYWPIKQRDVDTWIFEMTKDTVLSKNEYNSISVNPNRCMLPQQFSPNSSFYVDSNRFPKYEYQTIFAKTKSGEMDSISLYPIKIAVSNLLLSKDFKTVIGYVTEHHSDFNSEDRWLFVFSKRSNQKGTWYINIAKRIPACY